MKINYRNQIVENRKKKAFLALLIVLLVLLIFLVIGDTNNRLAEIMYEAEAIFSSQGKIAPSTYSYIPTLRNSKAKVLGLTTKTQDIRAYVLDEYFKYNNSPLYGTGDLFVKACNKYNVPRDCTTVAAIARAETNLCKYHVSASYYNCWGFGGGGPNRIRFKNWNRAIDFVTERLANSYGYRYMVDPREMEDVFCGSEPGCNGWGSRVLYHMKDISHFSRRLGFKRKLFAYR